MNLGQHVFSHQQQYHPGDPTWQMQHGNHQPQHIHQGSQHNIHTASAAAAAAAAQQQYHNRVNGNNGSNSNGIGAGTSQAIGAGDHGNFVPGSDQNVSAEERRILDWIAQLMNPATRETALLELSKKREQFPQLALILWHSFGICP